MSKRNFTAYAVRSADVSAVIGKGKTAVIHHGRGEIARTTHLDFAHTDEVHAFVAAVEAACKQAHAARPTHFNVRLNVRFDAVKPFVVHYEIKDVSAAL